MIFCDEVELVFNGASPLAVMCPATTLHCWPLLTGYERRQRRIKLLIHAQLCKLLRTQTTYEASPLAHTTSEGENRLVAYQFPDLYDSAMQTNSLSTASSILAQPLMKPLCTYKPSCFWNCTEVRNDYSLLYDVQMHVRPKLEKNSCLPFTTPKSDRHRTSNNVHYGA